jgi:thiamine-phosphate diphosphorylase
MLMQVNPCRKETGMPTPKERFNKNPGRIYCFADSVALCEKLLAAGARVIQMRHKTAGDREFTRIATGMLERVRRYPDAVLIINDRVDIAVHIGADGVHIGQEDEDTRQVLRRVPQEMIVGVSARYPDLAVKAEKAGATYVGTGSVAATPTKSAAVVIGLAGLRAVIAAVKIPVVAIGGIAAANIRQVAGTGARYCAVISEINSAPDPAGAYRELEARLV